MRYSSADSFPLSRSTYWVQRYRYFCDLDGDVSFSWPPLPALPLFRLLSSGSRRRNERRSAGPTTIKPKEKRPLMRLSSIFLQNSIPTPSIYPLFFDNVQTAIQPQAHEVALIYSVHAIPTLHLFLSSHILLRPKASQLFELHDLELPIR